ncbi:MAG TPA: SGNH/GDSL hydrolase family protein [Pirellulales bacterium]|nr:SGNH/GDSL hydrolase family protein [Pirellulales bacterium]
MSLRITSVYIWVAVLLACAELALQYRAHQRGWDAPLFRTAAASAATAREKPAQENPAQEKPVRYGPTADFPFRSQIVARERSADTLRLWVASASHAEDIYLGVEETFPAQTGRLLNTIAAGGHWQVLNASRAGNVIATNKADLSKLAREWRPNVVLLYQMSMEIVALSREHLGANRPTRKAHADTGPVEPRHESALERAAAETTTYSTLKANITPWIASQRVHAEDIGQAAEQDFDRRVRDFVKAVRDVGASPVLCTFGTSHSQDDAGRLPWPVRQFMLRYNRYLSPAGWTRAIARFNAALRQIAEEEGVPLVDCERAMTGQARYFRDFVHFTPEGHRRVAELLSEKILELSADSRIPHPGPYGSPLAPREENPEAEGPGVSGRWSVASGQLLEGHVQNPKSKIENPKSRDGLGRPSSGAGGHE